MSKPEYKYLYFGKEVTLKQIETNGKAQYAIIDEEDRVLRKKVRSTVNDIIIEFERSGLLIP